MTDRATGQVNASAADYYETHFVPALFKNRTGSLLSAAEVSAGDRVLDVGCGTGILARDAWQHMRRSGSVVGVDLNDGMIGTAGRVEPDIEWCVAPAESLPFETAYFDRVISQFALMFFENRVVALSEMWRVLRPGGRLALAVWDSLENTPGYAAMTALDARLFGQEVANELIAPYSLGDKEELKALFAAAGIADITITTHDGMAVFPSIEAWVALDVEGWTLGEMIGPEGHRRLKAAAEEELQEFVQADGSVAFLSPSHVITADKP
jgi:ubiquinone/menaquinone biosynthesis C-methylase UbiE